MFFIFIYHPDKKGNHVIDTDPAGVVWLTFFLDEPEKFKNAS